MADTVAEKELRSDQQHEARGAATVAGAASGEKRGGAVGPAGDAATKRMAAGGGAASADPDGGGSVARPEELLAHFAQGAATGDLATQIERLGVAGRLAFATHLPAALDETQQALVKMVFDQTPNGEVATLEQLIRARFAIRVVGPHPGADPAGVDWDAPGLRRSWSILESLPTARAEQPARFTPSPRGRADRGRAIGSRAVAVEEEAGDRAARGTLPSSANPFHAAALHEVGHAVDARQKISDGYCLGNPAGGDWILYRDDLARCTSELVAAADGAIHAWPDATQKNAMLGAIEYAMRTRALAPAELARVFAMLPFFGALAPVEKQAILDDPALAALAENRAANEPWVSGGRVLRGRVFQESDERAWSSYAAEARARKVSAYQFRAPDEWFAEAYAAYYAPGAPQGEKLASVDPATKAWIDEHVDAGG